MPKRSTPFQAIVHFVRKQTARPGVTVTESKELPDARLGGTREVDIVVEGDFDGERVTTSLEVNEHGRRASITWVEQLIAKHRNLPTTRLVLVSKSGFTERALGAVVAEGGWVQAMTPKIVQEDGRDVVESIYLDYIRLVPSSFRIKVHHPNKGQAAGRVPPDAVIRDADGQPLGDALDLAKEFIGAKNLVKTIIEAAHNHSERDNFVRFFVSAQIAELGYRFYDNNTGNLHLIAAIESAGKFEFKQSELIFTTMDLGNRRYGSGEGMIFGRPGVWVATSDTETAKVSWRMTDNNKPLFGLPRADTPPKFEALANMDISQAGLETVDHDLD